MTLLQWLRLLPLVASGAATGAFAGPADLMPLPVLVAPGEGAMVVTGGFTISAAECPDERVAATAVRAARRVAVQTGLILAAGTGGPALTIRCGSDPHKVQRAIEDESYSLAITSRGARLEAPSPYGALRGIETFLQLVEPGAAGWQVHAARIEDRPRFPWRGLLIDSCRHFMPVTALKRNLDAMAAVKLNVLHWHLSDDQGFRVQSRRFPRLHKMGADGEFYTQAEIRDIVAYARDRGIRVIPEFDVPGHTTAWFVGYPELAAAPGPYRIERAWGIFDPAMDPTREALYRFLGRFFGEMAGLFPDYYFHIGGDEVNGKQWDASLRIAEFKKEHDIASHTELQARFNARLVMILAKHGKKMVGWEEILDPSLLRDIVVQSWRRDSMSLAQAATLGFSSILSSGWYLNHMLPSAEHYAVDPLGKEAAFLSAEARARILGGEACLWSELVTAEMLDGRIWPRAAAIAERLWSPASVTDPDDMYRRLESVSQRLEWLGLTHRSAPRLMLQRLAAGHTTEALELLAEVLEPVKDGRQSWASYTSRTPLNRLVDAVLPESDTARRFARLVGRFLADASRREGRDEIVARLTTWQGLRAALAPVFSANPGLTEAEPIATDLSSASALALRTLDGTVEAGPDNAALLGRLAEGRADLLLMVAQPIRRIVEQGQGSDRDSHRTQAGPIEARDQVIP